ncbi:hypothetical protein FOCC_FOCC006209 [Frankliniella occidentalis]|nr:hypothetical protein FOCC_FOCC006209 [Frankliniella occidentalis]
MRHGQDPQQYIVLSHFGLCSKTKTSGIRSGFNIIGCCSITNKDVDQLKFARGQCAMAEQDYPGSNVLLS